eukprot:TRINITY_DN2136_c0_g1_i1.p1 TRINITY_DN2136_c0_g1~~TRINITY_DN2136_c0_g1_i1.p1  ORF type:complete len:96 (-),score=4.65 TRINITY_DN2136_c0_g1_i1:33-320(-)
MGENFNVTALQLFKKGHWRSTITGIHPIQMQEICTDRYSDVGDAQTRFLAKPLESAVSLAHANGESSIARCFNMMMLYLSWVIVTVIPFFWIYCF